MGGVCKTHSWITCHLSEQEVGGRSRRPEGSHLFPLLYTCSPTRSCNQRRSSEQPPRPLWTPRSFPDSTPIPTEILADQMKGIERVLDPLRPEFGSWLHHSSAKISWVNHFPSKMVTLMSVHLLGTFECTLNECSTLGLW